MVLRFLRDKRREKILARLAPEHWEEIVDQNVPHSRLLDETEFEELLRHTQILAAEKRFEGCGGLEITEEIKVTISAWGALLLLARQTDYYPQLQTILVYPSEFVVPVQRPLSDSVAISDEEARLGESFGEAGPGNIVLAWDEVLKCAGEWSEGVNVAVHEFAHQLDQEDGELNGVPSLKDSALNDRWKRVFESEFATLERVETDFSEKEGEEPLLDPYALTSPAEFFAVACETFWEWPKDLEQEHGELYGLLREYFNQDPAERWRVAERQGG
jgi:Mlc titration factor MtfA (ptsG expression regulator)